MTRNRLPNALQNMKLVYHNLDTRKTRVQGEECQSLLSATQNRRDLQVIEFDGDRDAGNMHFAL